MTKQLTAIMFLCIAFIFASCADEPPYKGMAADIDAASADTKKDNNLEEDTGPGEVSVPSECDNNSDCNDGVACTDDWCQAGLCQNVPNHIKCDDGDACTTDTCNPNRVEMGGCQHKTLACIDTDPCTLDRQCNPETGCDFSQPDPGACSGFKSKCREAECVIGEGCVIFEVSCEDGDLSTTDMCVEGVGCINQPVECDGQFNTCYEDACTLSRCISGKCEYNVIDCDDQTLCTFDVCDPTIGCQHIPNNGLCFDEDGLGCTIPTCMGTKLGCQEFPAVCDDENVCTYDSCIEPGVCSFEKISGCCLDSDDCSDGNSCTEDNCTPSHECEYVPVSCDDGIECTVDTPKQDGSVCECDYEPVSDLCPGDLYCHAEFGCVGCILYEDCDDGDPCTYDLCSSTYYSPYDSGEKPGICKHQPRCDWDGVQCVPNDQISEGYECLDIPGWCNSDWTCDELPKVGCAEWVCDKEAHQCVTEDKGDINCIPCTQETQTEDCPQGESFCLGEATVIRYTGVCNWQMKECAYYTTGCYDNDPCFNQECHETTGPDGKSSASCIAEEICPSDGNPCTQDCNPDTGACYQPIPDGDPCSDSNPCTIVEYCIDGYCVADQSPCDDNDPCTTNICTPQNPQISGGGGNSYTCSYVLDEDNPLCVSSCQTDADCDDGSVEIPLVNKCLANSVSGVKACQLLNIYHQNGTIGFQCPVEECHEMTAKCHSTGTEEEKNCLSSMVCSSDEYIIITFLDEEGGILADQLSPGCVCLDHNGVIHPGEVIDHENVLYGQGPALLCGPDSGWAVID